ncbi:kinase-like domain-containing protein, partial [Mycotypha africana]|uniref:kinase-like domain-containing protein n=1 Tax=Mycotypha africana TaxID=64632 RepID=UPI0023018315
EDYWKNVLTLSKSTFMKGWMPAIISPKRPDLYTQLLYHYFDYPLEIKKALSRSKRQLQWFPPQWFQQCQPLSPSGRMGQVYTSQSFVSIRSNDTITLEQLIPQVDQWSLQKLYRVALSLCSTVRNFHAQNKVHPNLQPKNILICSNTINNTNSDSQQLKHTLSESRRRSSTLVSSDNDSIELIDYWTSLPLCSHYGRYPYIAPELYIDVSNTSMTQKSNIYSLGIILWQLACGVIFPTSIHISSALYQLTACRHCLPPEYGDLIARCLNPNPSKRPSAEQLCECLLRLLM